MFKKAENENIIIMSKIKESESVVERLMRENEELKGLLDVK